MHSIRAVHSGLGVGLIKCKRSFVRNLRSTIEDQSTASGVIQFYDRFNARDLDCCMEFIAEDCVYEDTVFNDPFVGKTQIRNYFEEIFEYLDPEAIVKIDGVSADPAGTVGLLWHVQVGEYTIPFSRGCSFYRVNPQGEILFARDNVESTLKLGHLALRVLTLVLPIIKKLGPKANLSYLSELPIASGLMWAFYGYYTWIAFLSPDSPGAPVYQTSPETLMRVFHESVNFFYVNIFLNPVLPVIPSIAEHPVDEALFNFVGAWGLMFLPVMLADKRSRKMNSRTKWSLWIGTWFLTNVFFIPYQALRLAPEMDPDDEAEIQLPSWAPIVGILGGVIGSFSIFWVLFGRPEFGDIAERVAFCTKQFAEDRVFFAFGIDVLLFSIFQLVLVIDNDKPRLRYTPYIPFFGLVRYLLD